MPLDSKRIAGRMKEATKGSFPEKEGPAEDGAEGGEESRPGAMLIKALAAKDAGAIEEAIKACVGESY